MPASVETTSLRCKFKDSSDTTFSMSFAHADEEATASDVKALVDGIVTHKLLWERSPVSKVGAEFVTTTVTPVDVSD